MKYRAFLSYSRADDRVADWLHRELDSYRLPSSLVGVPGEFGAAPAKLHPIYRDRTDMSGGGSLSEKVQQALKESDALIVLCSPSAATSEWVNAEVVAFQDLRRSHRIYPVVCPDLPDSADLEGDYFPPALRGKGHLATDLRDLKLPDGRRIGDGRDGGRLKLLSGLLGLPLDTLAQRERTRQRRLIARLALASIVFALVALAAGVFGWRAYQNERIARARETDARNSLARILAERSWQHLETGEYFLAIRYALAGAHKAPANNDHYRAALARALYEAGSDTYYGFARNRDCKSVFTAPDRLLTTDINGAYVWDIETRRLLHTFQPQSDSDFVRAIVAPDEATIVTLGEDRIARFWQAKSGDMLGIAPIDEGAFALDILPVGPIAFSPDGSAFILGGSRASAWLFDRAAETRTQLKSGGQWILGADFSADSHHALTTDSNNVLRIWNRKTGETVNTIQPTEELGSALFSPQGDTVAIVSGNNIEIWDFRETRPTTLLSAHEAAVNSVEFSSDGRRLISASADATARIWDVVTGENLKMLSGDAGPLLTAAFSIDGSRAIAGAKDGTARVWDIESGRELARLRGHQGSVSASFCDAHSLMITSGSDGYSRLWDLSKTRNPRFFPAPEDGRVWNLALTSDGSTLATAHDNIIRIWDVRSQEEIATLPGSYKQADIFFTPNDESLLVMPLSAFNPDQAVYALHVTTGEIKNTIQSPIPSPAHNGTFFDRTGRRYIAETPDGVVIYDRESRAAVSRLPASEERLSYAEFSPDGSSVVTVNTWDNYAKIWDVETGNLLVPPMRHRSDISNARFSRDGGLLITSGGDGIAKVWRTKTGEVVFSLPEHDSFLTEARISPDGRLIVTASGNGAFIWDFQSRNLLAENRFDGAVESATFSPDSEALFIGLSSGRAELANIGVLNDNITELIESACRSALPPIKAVRSFSQEEIEADPLVLDVWLDGQSEDRDVCTDVPGAPALQPAPVLDD